MKYLCIIPAREGSKRLKNKNMKKLGQYPLIYWTLKLAIKCKYFSNIVVSTDSSKIINYTNKFKKVDIIKRPKSLATNNTKMDDVVKHAIKYYRNINKFYDAIVLLQPTSPLRTLNTVNLACKKFNKNLSDTLVSVQRVDHKSSPNRIFKIKNINKNFNNFFYPSKFNINYFRLDGGVVFIKKINKFKNNLLSGNTSFVEVKYPESIDIDNLQDFFQAKIFLKNKI